MAGRSEGGRDAERAAAEILPASDFLFEIRHEIRRGFVCTKRSLGPDRRVFVIKRVRSDLTNVIDDVRKPREEIIFEMFVSSHVSLKFVNCVKNVSTGRR